MEYLIIENGKIKAHRCSRSVPANAIVVENWRGSVGEPVDFYNKKWQRKSEFELMKEGLIAIPKGFKWNQSKTAIEEMTQVEKIEAGIEKLQENQIIENGEVRNLTNSELYKKGLLSAENFAAIKRNERDSLLSKTDKYLLPDFPIDEEKLNKIKAYRQYLRDLPQNENFPDVEIEELEV